MLALSIAKGGDARSRGRDMDAGNMDGFALVRLLSDGPAMAPSIATFRFC